MCIKRRYRLFVLLLLSFASSSSVVNGFYRKDYRGFLAEDDELRTIRKCAAERQFAKTRTIITDGMAPLFWTKLIAGDLVIPESLGHGCVNDLRDLKVASARAHRHGLKCKYMVREKERNRRSSEDRASSECVSNANIRKL